MNDFKNIKHLLRAYPPATPNEIIAVEKKLAIVIPNIYKKFLYTSNGALLNFANLYGTSSLIEMNTLYEVQQYAPHYLTIGNDGGGYHLLMKAEKSAKEIRLVSDSIGTPTNTDCVDIFEDWLSSNDGNPWRNKITKLEEPSFVNLILIHLPTDGKKGVLRLKKLLRLNISIGELFELTKDLPLVLLKEIIPSRAKAIVKNFGEENIFEIHSI